MLDRRPQHLQIVINLLSLSALPEWILSHLVWFKCVEELGVWEMALRRAS
jgi:hypothetical protein